MISYFTPPLINAESILVWKTLRELTNHVEVDVISSRLPRTASVDQRMVMPTDVHVFRQSAYQTDNHAIRKVTQRLIGLIADEQSLWARFGTLPSLDYHLLYSRSHPGSSHMLAYRLHQTLKKPWIAQFSDPWANNPYHTHHTGLRKASDRRWEEKVVQAADVLVFPTKEIAKMYFAAYPTFHLDRKSVILPHHYAPDLYPDDASLLVDDTAKVSFAYFGDFYGLRSPAPLIHALNVVGQQSPRLLERIRLSFYGNVESKFEELLNQSPVPVSRQKLTYFESLRRMKQTDVLLLVDAPSKDGVNPFLASKVMDYLGAGKPILGITDTLGTSAEILRRHGHQVVSPHDIEGIAHVVENCMTTPRLETTSPNEYSTAFVVGKLADIMLGLIQRGRIE